MYRQGLIHRCGDFIFNKVLWDFIENKAPQSPLWRGGIRILPMFAFVRVVRGD